MANFERKKIPKKEIFKKRKKDKIEGQIKTLEFCKNKFHNLTYGELKKILEEEIINEQLSIKERMYWQRVLYAVLEDDSLKKKFKDETTLEEMIEKLKKELEKLKND